MKIELFTSPQCRYCEKAKQLLQIKGVEFDVFDIVASDSHRQDLFKRLPNCRTLPQIFLDGNPIGSYEDLQLFVDSGGLEAVVA